MDATPLSITIGITTRYGSDGLLETVASINRSRNLPPFRLIILSDAAPLRTDLLSTLQSLGAEVIENPEPSSQAKKQRQILEMTASDIIVFTEDDVLFEEDTLAKGVACFTADPTLDFVSMRSQPMDASTVFEGAINIGSAIVHKVAQRWNNGHNYLTIDGRCMLFRTETLKTISIPDDIVSLDAYLYLAYTERHLKYRYHIDGAVRFRNPQHLDEHRRKSSRFQHEDMEMQRYFPNCDSEFSIPRLLLLKVTSAEVLKQPAQGLLYIVITLYTRLFPIAPDKALNTLWEVDPSTKKSGLRD